MRALAVTILLAAAPAVATARPMRQTRPMRAIVILADDLGVDRVGCYGAERVRTPNIDKLAEQGVRFTRCWSNPTCSPTRGTVVTGQYGFRTGIGRVYGPDAVELDPATPTIADLFDTADVLGKWHLSIDPVHPLECRFRHHFGSMGNVSLSSGFDYYRWEKNRDGMLAELGAYATIDTALDALRSDAQLRYVAFNAPHGPVHLPPLFMHTYGHPDDRATLYRAMVESLDYAIGRLLADLDDDTLVIFLGDNGTPPFAAEGDEDPERLKFSVYEGGVHVPLIVAGPGVARGATCDALVNSVDVFATLAEAFGVGGAGTLDSRSFWHLAVDPASPVRRGWVYAEFFHPGGFGPFEKYRQAIRGERYKLIRIMGGREELFDLERDPGERDNLLPTAPNTAADAAYHTLRSRLPVVPF